MPRLISCLIRSSRPLVRSLALPILLAASAAAQPHPVAQPVQPARPVAPLPVASERDLANTQQELIKLLRLSPTLTTVVEHDPSLLANQDYVSHTNPQLAQFLQVHPEIALNPDFYLFTRLHDNEGNEDQALERAVWPELVQPRRDPSVLQLLLNDGGPFVIFLAVTGALLWLIRLFLENRRWSRIFKLQMDVHGKLIDKFASTAELHSYMETEAGRRFLEAAPLPVHFDQDQQKSQRLPNALARVLMPLQIGIVLSLLGVGFLMLRHSHRELDIPMLVFGTLVLMPGLGFILSAGITWLLASRLGLMPEAVPASKPDARFDPRDRQ